MRITVIEERALKVRYSNEDIEGRVSSVIRNCK